MNSIERIYFSIYYKLIKQDGQVNNFLDLASIIEEYLVKELDAKESDIKEIVSLHEEGIDLVLSNRENNKNFSMILSTALENNLPQNIKDSNFLTRFTNAFFYSFAKLNYDILKYISKHSYLPVTFNYQPLIEINKNLTQQLSELQKINKSLVKKIKGSDVFYTKSQKLVDKVNVYLNLIEQCEQDKEISLEMLEKSSGYTRSKSSWHNDLKLISFWRKLEILLEERINEILHKINKTKDELKKDKLLILNNKLIFRQNQIHEIIDDKEKARDTYKKKFKRNNADLNKFLGNVKLEQPNNSIEYYRNQLNYKPQSDDKNYAEDEDKRGIREGYYSSLQDPFFDTSNSLKNDPESDYNGSKDIETSEREEPQN